MTAASRARHGSWFPRCCSLYSQVFFFSVSVLCGILVRDRIQMGGKVHAKKKILLSLQLICPASPIAQALKEQQLIDSIYRYQHHHA
jgi:hypothetical protein